MDRTSILLLAAILAIPACRSGHSESSSRGDALERTHSEVAHTPPAVEDLQTPSSVLRVNDDLITIEDVLDPLKSGLRADGLASSRTQRERLIIERVQAELVAQVQDLLLYQEASKGITDQILTVVDQYVDREIRDRVTREFGGRQSRFEVHLASLNMTLEDARQKVRRRIVVVKYLQDNIIPKIADPTRGELLEYYDANIQSYTEPARRELFMIQIPKTADPESARAEIERAHARLLAGEAFETVAREVSKGIHAAEGGGWGYIQSPLQGRFAAPSAVFFALGGEQISEIVEADDAFFIVRTGEVVEARTRGFAEVQPELVERFRNAQFDILRSEMLREFIDRAIIEPREDLFVRAVVEAAEEQLVGGQ